MTWSVNSQCLITNRFDARIHFRPLITLTFKCILFQPTDLLLKNNQAAINGIRGAGARQLILAPGNGFTGGHSWTQTTGAANDAPSSDFMNKLVDPAHNLAIDVHEVSLLLHSRNENPVEGSDIDSTWMKIFRDNMTNVPSLRLQTWLR